MYGLNKVAAYIDKNAVKAVISGDQNLAFWDAQLKTILAEKLKNIEFWQLVHDVDYVSKIRDSIPYENYGGDGYATVPHNSTFTLDIWTAAFEIMSLFGGEIIIDPFELRNHQYPWKVIIKRRPKVVDKMTEAFGWRGIVNIANNNIIAGEIRPRNLEDEIKKMVEFAITNTKEVISYCQDLNFRPLYVIQETLTNNGLILKDASLKAFRQSLKLMSDGIPENIKLGSSSEFLRFNTNTCYKSRFQILDIFINPETKDLALEAYNKALEGTTIAEVNKFGEGAIPFDLYIPAIGRSTIHIIDKELYITSGINHKKVVAAFNWKGKPSLYNIAEEVEKHFGPNVSLVGKAIVLPLMLLNEFPIVLNERGSSYFPYVHKLYDNLKKQNIHLKLHPVIRTVFNSLDAIRILKNKVLFKLPEHLVFVSGEKFIDATTLAVRWRSWVAKASSIYNDLLTERSPEKILQLIISYCLEEKQWVTIYREYKTIKETLANEEKRESLSIEEKENFKKRKEELEEAIHLEKLRLMCYCKKVEALELFNHRTPWWCLFIFGKDWFTAVKNNAAVYLEEF